jgi:hypothetical protein
MDPLEVISGSAFDVITFFWKSKPEMINPNLIGSSPVPPFLISPVRLREAPSFKVGERARLRVNLEQVPAFKPGVREVHSLSGSSRPCCREASSFVFVPFKVQ